MHDDANQTNQESHDARFLVVRNAIGQYSIWPEQRALPQGWDAVGQSAAQQDCLDRIRGLWTEIGPSKTAAIVTVAPESATLVDPDIPLVSKLTMGLQSIAVWDGASTGREALRRAAQSGYLHLQVLGHKGVPTITMQIDPMNSDLEELDSVDPNLRLDITAFFTLDGSRCRCLAQINPISLVGTAEIHVF